MTGSGKDGNLILGLAAVGAAAIAVATVESVRRFQCRRYAKDMDLQRELEEIIDEDLEDHPEVLDDFAGPNPYRGNDVSP